MPEKRGQRKQAAFCKEEHTATTGGRGLRESLPLSPSFPAGEAEARTLPGLKRLLQCKEIQEALFQDLVPASRLPGSHA